MTARARVFLCATVLVLLAAAALTVVPRRATVRAAAADTFVPPNKFDPAKMMGVKVCQDCHKPEVDAWKVSRHQVNFDNLAMNPNAKKYAAALGITPANITQEGACVNCHGLKAEGTALKSITGVSCESCHGPSGGETGWLNPHGSYGAKGLTREQESAEHKKQRQEQVDKAGMVRPAHIYALAKNCLGCHLVNNEELVNKAGHKAGSAEFELVSWVSGDVAHNLFLDAHVNAAAPSLWASETKRTAAERRRLQYVLGKMAEVEVSLRNLAGAADDGAFVQAMAARAKTASGTLDDLRDFVKELDPVVTEFKKIKLKLKPANKESLLKVADQVAQVAKTIEATHTGAKLADVDQLISKTGNGPRYAPAK